jgi:monoamine oxidase
LGAARRLAAAGLSVHVLEARNRLGGRAWTARDPSGLPIEFVLPDVKSRWFRADEGGSCRCQSAAA